MNKNQIKVLTIEISKLNLREDDYLIVKVPEGTRENDVIQCRDVLKETIPGLKAVIFIGEVQLEVIHKEQVNE